MDILPRDENGFSTLHLKNHPKGNSFLLSHTRFPAVNGNEMLLTGLVKGTGKAFLHYCRYDVNRRNCGYSKGVSIPLSGEFTPFEVKINDGFRVGRNELLIKLDKKKPGRCGVNRPVYLD